MDYYYYYYYYYLKCVNNVKPVSLSHSYITLFYLTTFRSYVSVNHLSKPLWRKMTPCTILIFRAQFVYKNPREQPRCKSELNKALKLINTSTHFSETNVSRSENT